MKNSPVRASARGGPYCQRACVVARHNGLRLGRDPWHHETPESRRLIICLPSETLMERLQQLAGIREGKPVHMLMSGIKGELSGMFVLRVAGPLKNGL